MRNISYTISFSNNYFDPKYGNASRDKNVMAWLSLSSHEVGHLADIKELGLGKAGYMTTFLLGYAAALSHDGHPREKRADIGEDKFRSFNEFVNIRYGEGKLKSLFDNPNNTDKDIIGRLDQWWTQYQKPTEATNKSTNNGKE